MFKRMAGATFVVLLAMGGGTASAVGTVAMLELDPETVEPGDTLTVKNAEGSECPGALVIGDSSVQPHAWSVVPEESGDWLMLIQIPDSGPRDPMGNPTPYPPGEHTVNAVCYAECPAGYEHRCGTTEANAGIAYARAAGFEGFTYQAATFTVVAPAVEEPEDPEPTTPMTETPTADTTPDTTPDSTPVENEAVQAADAAAPTTARPTVRGSRPAGRWPRRAAPWSPPCTGSWPPRPGGRAPHALRRGRAWRPPRPPGRRPGPAPWWPAAAG